MTDLDRVRELVAQASASLEASRQRIDDLNVYPVPDGDTGTNLALTCRAVVESLQACTAVDRTTLARELARSALMGARGNSGVILSQIVRGAAEVVGGAGSVDARAVATALRSASDAAYRAVRRPVEGTMLTLIRELAEEAEEQAPADPPLAELLPALVRRGEDAVARTPQYLAVLREAGVVDAGAAGLLEILRGLAAAVAGEPVPAAVPAGDELRVEAIHQELSRYRYCTVFVVEGTGLDAGELEEQLDPLGDSLLVVGDASTLKIHVHTDDPGAALSAGTRAGVIANVEVANMHTQTLAREERLLHAVPDVEPAEQVSAVVAVVAGEGNRRLYESFGAAPLIEGGQTMNPSTAEILEAIEAAPAPEVLVLPNNPNVIMSAEQAAGLAEKTARVVRSDSLQGGLAAMVAFDPSRTADENAEAMRQTLEHVVAGAVTVASRDAELNGVVVRRGNYLGLAGGDAVAGGAEFEPVARAVIERLLAEPREVLTLLTGKDEPELDPILELLAERYPDVELDVHAGGQPHYPLLLAAE